MFSINRMRHYRVHLFNLNFGIYDVLFSIWSNHPHNLTCGQFYFELIYCIRYVVRNHPEEVLRIGLLPLFSKMLYNICYKFALISEWLTLIGRIITINTQFIKVQQYSLRSFPPPTPNQSICIDKRPLQMCRLIKWPLTLLLPRSDLQ